MGAIVVPVVTAGVVMVMAGMLVDVIVAVTMVTAVFARMLVCRFGDQRGMCAIVRAWRGRVGVRGRAVRIVIQGHRQL